MIIKDRFGFVISRDGYILSTNFVQSIFSAAMIQYGPLATTDCHHYVFPLGGKVKSNVEADLVFAAIGHINQMLKWNTAGQERANVGKTRLEKMAKVNKDLVAMRETYIKKLNEYRHPVTKKIEHYAVTLDADGIIAERTVSYELDAEFPQDKRYYRNERSIYLPIGPGSEWAIASAATDINQVYLETVLKSTKTKEEALDLLVNINAIDGGVWYTPEEFVKHINLPGLLRMRKDEVMDKVAMDLNGEKIVGVKK